MGADQAGAEQQGMQEAYSLGVPHVKVGPALHMLRASLHVHLSIRNRWQAGQLHELSHIGAVAAWVWVQWGAASGVSAGSGSVPFRGVSGVLSHFNSLAKGALAYVTLARLQCNSSGSPRPAGQANTSMQHRPTHPPPPHPGTHTDIHWTRISLMTASASPCTTLCQAPGSGGPHDWGGPCSCGCGR